MLKQSIYHQVWMQIFTKVFGFFYPNWLSKNTSEAHINGLFFHHFTREKSKSYEYLVWLPFAFQTASNLTIKLFTYNVMFIVITLHFTHFLWRAFGLHMTTKCIPMLQQIHEGLKVYNLIEVMQRKLKECHDLFVTGCNDKVCWIYLNYCHLIFLSSYAKWYLHIIDTQCLF